jgi:hypothetical protein
MNAKKKRARTKPNAYPAFPSNLLPPSAEAIAKAEAKIEGEKARLRAKAAEAPTLRQEARRLEWQLLKYKFNVAKLAALIHPELCEKKPVEAVKLAIRLLRAVDQAGPTIDAEDRKAKAQAARAEVSALSLSYDEGVRFITAQHRPERAKKYFEQFLLGQCATKAEAVATLRRYEGSGFTGLEVIQLRKEFTAWWPERNPKKGKQGRVKDPEKDKRKEPRPAPLPKRVRERLGRSRNESE